MSSTRIETPIDEAQAAFDRCPESIDPDLDVEDAAPLRLRKTCRLLAGARALRDRRYDTLVTEASFVAMEPTVEFRLLERGHVEPDDPPVHIRTCTTRRPGSGGPTGRLPAIWPTSDVVTLSVRSHAGLSGMFTSGAPAKSSKTPLWTVHRVERRQAAGGER